MFVFRWKVLERCEPSDTNLALWEVSALFRFEASVEDIELDRDCAVEFYIDTQVPDGMKDDYRHELQMAEDEMLDAFASDLRSKVVEREAVLASHYPFTLRDDGVLCLRPRDDLTAVGAAYLCLQFYRCWTEGLIEIEENDETTRRRLEKSFNTWFPKVFEIIAGYAVSGDKTGVPHVTAHCRSSQRLHQMFTALCKRLGSGRPKRYADWSLPQQQSNDGGIDCIVHVGGPGMPGNASLLLVGATVQKNQIDHKIIGEDARRRFSDFFAERPGALQGALVRPCDADALTVAKCRDRDCLLYTYNEIWRSLAKRIEGEVANRPFKLLDGRLRTKIQSLNGAILLDKYSQHTLQIGRLAHVE